MTGDGDQRLVDEIAACFHDPLRFVRLVFDWGHGELRGCKGPDAEQTGILRQIGAGVAAPGDGAAFRLAVASGHGIGKTTLIAWAILWFMSTRVNCAGIVTANTRTQLETRTWRELGLWHRRALNSHWFRCGASKLCQVDHPDSWFVSAVPWNAARPEAFAGLHARDVLVVYDEASAIDDAIWEVSEGALTTPGALWLAFGNPTRNSGRFYDCFHGARHRWTTRQVDARRSRFASARQIAQWRDDYGEDSDFFRVRVRGEFPNAGVDQFISPEIIAEARRSPGAATGPLVLGVDVARFGDDQTVLALRNGHRVAWLRRHRGLDLMQTAARVAAAITEVRPDAVLVDGVGLGAGVVDRLRQMGYRVQDVNAGSRASDAARFANLRAEMWSRLRDWLAAGGAIPAGDLELAADLAAPNYGFDSRSRLQLESKRDIKARGGASPDAADALALTFARPVAPRDLMGARHATAAPPRDPFADLAGEGG